MKNNSLDGYLELRSKAKHPIVNYRQSRGVDQFEF